MDKQTKSALIMLAQSDTTAGFLSTNERAINAAKGRYVGQCALRCVADLAHFSAFSRAPNAHKNLIRRARKTTFIFRANARALRVSHDALHNRILRHFSALYSSSANAHGARFSRSFAISRADIVALDRRGLSEEPPSRLLKLARHHKKRIR